MAIEVKISGTTYRAADDFIIRQQAGAVSLSTVSILKETNPIPQPLQAAQILIDETPVFYGIISTVQDPPTSTGYEPRRYTIDIQSMEVIFNFRLVKRNWYNQRIDQIITDIFTDYIAEEGITLGGISEITEQISAYRKTYSKVSEILDELAEKVGRASYYISPDKKFYFLIRDEFTTVDAPTHVTEITKTRSYGDLRTVQIVRGASAGITGIYTNLTAQAAIAALSGTSGKIENLKSDSSIRNPTAASLDAIATAEKHAEEEITLSCVCHDLIKSALYTEWGIYSDDIWPVGSSGYFVVVERSITSMGHNAVSVRVTLKNRNYFARYGYSLKTLASSASTSQSRLDDENSPDRLTPAKKAIARRDFTTAKNTLIALDAQATALGITTEKTAYDSAFHALGIYLNGGAAWDGIATPAWLADEAMTITEEVTGTEYDSAWSAYYIAKTALEEAIYAGMGQQISQEIMGSLPRCLGLYPYSYRESIPVANEADLVVLYSTETAEQGIYKFSGEEWEKVLAPTPDQVGRCFLYILSAVTATVRTDSAGNTISDAYGTSANYAPDSVAFEILLARFIFAQDITATGSITGLFIRSTDKRVSVSNDGDGADDSDGINVGTHDLTGAPTGQKIQIARGYSLFGSEIQVLRFLQAVGGAWRERLQQYISVAGYPVIRDPYSGLSIMFEYPNKLKIYKTGTDANSGTSAIVEIDGLSARGAITAGDYIDAPLLKTNRLETFLGDELTTNYGFDLAKIDDDSTPVASKSSGSLDSGQRSGLFTVYKSITVYMQSTNIVLDLYYNGSYIEILRPGKATPLNPGRYSFRNESESDGQSGILRCPGVYGSVNGGHIWS
ncbi:MAG: hypothetical protein AAGU26_05730 [bacterium]|jgi:hypothetical protein